MSINELLAGGQLLKNIAGQQATGQGWQDWLCAQLPAELAAHITGVTLRGETLLVQADQASWASRLRYELAPLAAAATARDRTIKKLRVATRAGA